MALPADRDYWRRKPLAEMSREEWEALCDGCGKCCLIKLEDEATGTLAFTDVACRLLDPCSARCRNYRHRRKHVPDCVKLTPDNVGDLSFMPPSCAYRLLAEGQPLPDWHPLVSGDPETVHLAGMSVRHRVIGEDEIADEQAFLDHIVDWPRRR